MEYKFFVCNGETFQDDEESLNELGSQGWRVMTVALSKTREGHTVLLLEREAGKK